MPLGKSRGIKPASLMVTVGLGSTCPGSVLYAKHTKSKLRDWRTKEKEKSKLPKYSDLVFVQT
jgi:hypothetical protein